MTNDSPTNRPQSRPDIAPSRSELIAHSPAMREVNALLDKIADTSMSVCLWGESGTGKRFVGRAIHDRSSRRAGPFVVADCTADSEEIIECRLFGTPDLAVNGAHNGHDCMLARAHGGTLVLNELPTLGPRLQAKLLEVLRTRRLSGDPGAPRINVRVVSTMSTDPVRAVDDGTLVEDLYYRVAVVMVRMPALRERPEDIPRLVEFLLRRISTRYRRPMLRLGPGIVERMLPLPWPGNVGQLEDLLRHAFLLAEGDAITDQDLSRGAMALEREGGVSPLRKVS